MSHHPPPTAPEADVTVRLPLDLDGLVALLTRSALALHLDEPSAGRASYVATWRVDAPGTGSDADRAPGPIAVRSTVDRVTAAVWSPGASVQGAVANVERSDTGLRVVVRPPRPAGDALPAGVVHLPVDLPSLVSGVEVGDDQPGWLRQAVAAAIQASHAHGLELTSAT